MKVSGIEDVRELFTFQEKGMNRGYLEVLARLEVLEQWPPGKHIRLRIEDV